MDAHYEEGGKPFRESPRDQRRVRQQTDVPASGSYSASAQTEPMTITKKYRSRSQYIEAVELTADNAEWVAQFCGGYTVTETDPFSGEAQVGINFPTLDGTKRLQQGHYLIREARRNFVALSPTEFQQQYLPI